jgi:asparagine synthase (glutamine-hydrolysing)
MAIYGVAVAEGGRPAEIQQLEAMATALKLTDTDVCDFDTAGGCGFGTVAVARRSSAFSDQQITVVCDADLYNLPDLRRIAGADAQGTCAELIAVLYLQRGQSLLDLLRGAFALAIWDGRERALLLARDRLGICPLHYGVASSDFVFASYPRGIFASGRIDAEIDPEAILEYINYNVVPAPRSAFRKITKVNPGECVLWNGELRLSHYWQMKYPEDAIGSHKQLADELYARLEDSVRVTSSGLNPDRTGCFLSGGTDSSSITGLFGRIHGQPANTFSIGFAEGDFNELYYARVAVQHYKTNHHEYTVTPQDAYNVIPKIAEWYDEPFGNSSAIPTYWCSKLARDHGMDVLLAGDGGDELLGGNERYLTNEIYARYRKLPALVRRGAIEPIVSSFRHHSDFFEKVQRHIDQAYIPNPERYDNHRFVHEFPMLQIIGPALPHNGDHLATVRGYYSSALASSDLNRLMFIDVNMILGDDDIPKVMRTSESAGIEVRFPYLDHLLAEFSGRIPVDLKIRWFKQRYLFKQATSTLLPREILRKKKHGFGVPIGVWVRTDPKLRSLSRDVLLDPRTYQRGFFRREFVEQLMANAEDSNNAHSRYYGNLLYLFLILELWYRQHIEGPRATPSWTAR